MKTNCGWPNVLRVVWISGGIVAVNEPGPNVEIEAGMSGSTLYRFQIKKYGDLFAALQKMCYPLIGCTFFVDPAELQGLRVPEFRATGNSAGWHVWDAKQKWRQIAFAASRNEQMQLMDVASRIASGLRYSQMRLRDLAEAYSLQLRGRLHEDGIKDYQAFSDKNSFEVYKEIHALFWEMAVLRDTLAEFAALFCFSIAEVRSLSRLLKLLSKTSQTDPLAIEILRASDPASSGWLWTFTNYRNFFTHVAPLEQAANLAFAVQDMRKVEGMSVPQIYYPLPRDIEQLIKERPKSTFFKSWREINESSTLLRDRASQPDALDYLHGCLNQLSELALVLLTRSPIAPTPIMFRPEDVREITWKG